MYTVIINDSWEVCPGTIKKVGFRTERAAYDWAQAELDAATKLFTDGRSKLWYKVIEER